MTVWVVLGLLVALGYSVADYAGGAAGRRAPLPTVVLIAEAASLLVTALALVFLGVPSGSGPVEVLAGIGASVVGVVSMVLFFRGMADGPVAVISPLAALVGTAVPVLVSVVAGQTLSPLGWSGVALGLLATPLLALGPTSGNDAELPAPAAAGGVLLAARPTTSRTTRVDGRTRVAIARGALSGVGFGVYFAVYGQLGETGRGLPLLAGYVVVLTGLAVMVLVLPHLRAVGRRSPGSVRASQGAGPAPGGQPRAGAGLTRVVVWLALVVGAFNAAGAIGFIVVATETTTAVAAVLLAVYPGITVGFARVLRGERASRTQVVGLALTLGAVALLGAGGS